MKGKRVLVMMCGICLGLALVAAPFTTANAESSPAQPTGELRIGLRSLYTETFHPFLAPCPFRKVYHEPLYDYLVGLDAAGNPDPEESIAYKWEEAPDHLSWTFWIRDGVTFHDGTPLTVEDVKYSYDQTLQPGRAAGGNLRPVVKGTEIVPPNKMVIHLNKPSPVLPYYLTPYGQGEGVVIPKKYLEKVGEEGFEKNPIGSGPYKFLEKKEASHIKYVVAQDRHWRVGTPKYKYLTFKLLSEEGTRVATLRSGEVDLIQVGITRANELEAAGIPIHEKKGAVNIFLDFLRAYETDNPLNKKEVRQALIYAIDKKAILKHVLMGRGELIGHVFMMFNWSISYKEYPVTPYDPDRAKQLLAEAGYPDGFTVYLYSYVTSIPEQKLINEAIAGYWEAIGMDVKIVELEAGAFFAIWTKHKEPLGPAAFNHSWSSRPVSPWAVMYHSDVEKNMYSQVKDPVMDQLIEKYQSATTMGEYIAAERACEERALEMFHKSGTVGTAVFFASSKDVPGWGMGRGIDSYRFEYIGATK